MEVETVSVPENAAQIHAFTPTEGRDAVWVEFHPASCRVAYIRAGKKVPRTETRRTLHVWDARASKFLLPETDVHGGYVIRTFSSDGRFFACNINASDVCLWKESSSGYTLLETLTQGPRGASPLLSPDGESIIISTPNTIRLWRTKSFATTPSSVSIQPPQNALAFLLEFVPDRPFAAIARKMEKTVTVLDLKSGVPQLTIDSSMEVYGLKPIENTIVVIGEGKAIGWNLPGGNLLPCGRTNVGDSTWTINFPALDKVTAATISHDLRAIAIATERQGVWIFDARSSSVRHNIEASAQALWFAPGGKEIWCTGTWSSKVFTIARKEVDRRRHVLEIDDGTLGSPWGSSHGYKFTDDGLILGADRRRLLMLPSLWRSGSKVHRVWNGQFLALLHAELSEPVILEFLP